MVAKNKISDTINVVEKKRKVLKMGKMLEKFAVEHPAIYFTLFIMGCIALSCMGE